MSDYDHFGQAWRISPSDYLKTRPSVFSLGEPKSQYVTMKDGIRLAIDVYLPGNLNTKQSAKFPTIMVLTPYYRRFKITEQGAEPAPNIAIYRDFFVSRGYALVTVDVRGCGASFGTRDCFRSPREREDYRELADWVVSQTWSNGIIGSTGISYLGAAACFLASTGHPAVKAIAPLFAVQDTYTDHVFPGGIKCTTVTENYDALVSALDLDLRDSLAPYPYFSDKRYSGPQPVDEDLDGHLVAAAIEEHKNSFRMRDLAPEFAFREEASSHDPEMHSGSFSPYWYLGQVTGKVNIYSVSGWYDGSSFVNGSIARFLSNEGADNRLLLGPWDHGARANGSPWKDEGTVPKFSILSEVLRFFDQHLCGMNTGLDKELPIHFHTLHEEKWKASDTWPPKASTTRLFLSENAILSTEKPKKTSNIEYQTSFSTGTGKNTRFERLGALAVTEYYKDWQGREDNMLSFTTAAFEVDAEVSGHSIVQLHVSTSERDAGIFVYLSELDDSGRSIYVTEGNLRLLHRKEGNPPNTYKAYWPFRTFHRKDAIHMQPGTSETVRFALLPISWKFSAGSRLQISIAGGDTDHFSQVTHGRPPKLTFTVGGDESSFIELPMIS